MLILKDNRDGKLDAKSEKGIFLGYSTRSKAYKCLNSNTNKIVESANVRIDEFVELHGDEDKRKNQKTIGPSHTFMKVCLLRTV